MACMCDCFSLTCAYIGTKKKKIKIVSTLIIMYIKNENMLFSFYRPDDDPQG